ncbi:MAG: LytTR family DNA-binding domain-containing protein [Vicingaceae bacterium]
MKPALLQQPYPLHLSWKKEIISAFLYGLFIFGFLYIFQPFGLSNYHSETKVYQLLGYGLVTTFVLLSMMVLVRLFFTSWYSEKNWTVGKNIFFTTLVLLFIGTANLLYSVSLDYLKLSLQGFLFYQGVTIAVGLIPVTIGTLLNYHKKLKAAVKEASDLNASIQQKAEHHELIEIPSKNKSEELKVELDQLLALKAVENYLEVYLNRTETTKKEIIRNTLSEVEQSLSSYPSLKRCHRSFLVNLDQVESFSGNAQGLSLRLKNSNTLSIPVSRSYVKEIKAVLA